MSRKRKLWTLRKDLHGHYQKVADRAKRSVSLVSRVLNDKVDNDEVLAIAIEVRKEIMIEKAQKLIIKQNLLNQIRK